VVVLAALAVKQVLPGGGGHVLAAIDVVFDVRHVRQHAGLNQRTDVEARAVVEIGVPAQRLPVERLPAHEDVVGFLAP
jgi:hypothetical protein